MPKIKEKKTTSTLVYYYKFSNLTTAGELDAWFAEFLASAENLVQFDTVCLSDLYGRNSEDSYPAELTIQDVRGGVLQPMRNAQANHLEVKFSYQGTFMVMGVALGKWVVSLGVRRSDADKLDDLVSRLSLDQA